MNRSNDIESIGIKAMTAAKDLLHQRFAVYVLAAMMAVASPAVVATAAGAALVHTPDLSRYAIASLDQGGEPNNDAVKGAIHIEALKSGESRITGR